MVYNINSRSRSLTQVTIILSSLTIGRLITSSPVEANIIGHNKSGTYVSMEHNTLHDMNIRTINIVNEHSVPLTQLMREVDQPSLSNQVMNVDINELIDNLTPNQICTLIDKMDKVILKKLHDKLIEHIEESALDKLTNQITIAKNYQYTFIKLFAMSFTSQLILYLSTSLLHYIYSKL